MSADSKQLAYGRMVQELLSQSRASTWINDLWDMYTGYTLFAQQSGYDPQGHDKFVSFKTMVFFFQEIEKMEKAA
ncbi:hypothetical protein [Dyadobacter luticola]|uniref:Uncharacterized protein n=1 Tax=Dyadobacter luticola TaxID=1979387 RepID=A0A5R9L585_9BACT|nr:hypothetical protein [Dyadobacter luticola]TLV03425.1 hypothetical protein FEN17_07410 [Dyadobacter luticola]